MANSDVEVAKTVDVSTLDLTTAKQYYALLEHINDTEEQRGKIAQRILELEAKSLAHIKDRIKELEKEQKLLNDFEKVFANRGESSKREYEFEANKLKILENQIELVKKGDDEELKKLKEFVEQNKEKLKDSKLELNDKDNLIAAARILVNLKKEEVDTAKQLNQQTKDIISSTLGISARWKETFFGKLLDSDGNSLKNMKAIGLAMKDTFTLQNVMGSTLMKIQEATVQAFIAYDMAASSLAKVAGANERLQNVLENTARGATAYGISFQEAGRSIEALYSNLNTFSNLNQSAQQQLTISVAKLDRLGISSQEATKQIGTLTQIMGMSEVQAGKTSEQLSGFALAIGKTPQQISQDFAAASNSLAAYGNNMVNVFKDLEAQSKATGVAVGELIAITEKFQTFEGAAQAAGKLNAALGGGFINAMELLEASSQNPAAAIDLLRTRLDEAGMSFNQMSFYEKKMIADAAGFKSIEEANRILSMSNAEREKAAKGDAERADQQKLLNEAVQRSIPLQEKLTMIFVNFGIVMGPVVNVVSSFLSGIAEFLDKNPAVVTALSVILGLFAAYKIVATIGGWFKLLASGIGLFNTVAAATAPVAGPAGAALEGLGAAAGAAAPGIAEFGAAMFVVAAGVGLAAAGLGLLYMGVGSMLEGLTKLFSVLANTDSIADSLLTLSLAMSSVSLIFTNPIVIGGLLIFSAALAGIVFTLNKLDKEKSFNFAAITKNISELSVKTSTSPNGVVKQTGDLIKEINSFNLGSDAASNLEKILKAAIPQQQATTVNMSPSFVVKIGNKVIDDIVIERVDKVMGNAQSATPVVYGTSN